MKLFISIDLEGISGIYQWGDEKDDAKRMVRDLNIVLRTIKEHDIWNDIESIVVADSHGFGRNIAISDLEIEKTYLIGGARRIDFMMQGLDSSYDACLLIGYHSRAGVAGGILDHSYSNRAVKEVRVNGRICGETEINAYLAGYYEVPVIFSSGDDILQNQIIEFYDKGFPYALVKKGISKDSAMIFPEDLSKKNLTYAVKESLNLLKSGQAKKYLRKAKNPVSFSVKFKDSSQAYSASLLPFVTLINGDTIEFVMEDYRDSFRLFEALLVMARG